MSAPMNESTPARHAVIAEDLASIRQSPEDWQRFAGTQVLIAGATGSLAAYLVEFFASLSEQWPQRPVVIHALARSREKLERRFPHLLGHAWFRPLIQDVCDPVVDIERLDYIVHGASPGSPKYYLRDPVGTARGNVLGAMNLLELARRTGARLLFMSSGAVYGTGDSKASIAETDFGVLDPLDGTACYSESKRMAETLCADYWRQYGVPAVIARISHTYGPGVALDDGRSFADFIADALAGRDIVLNSDGSSSRPFCYIADATAAFLILLLRGEAGQAYNVGMDREMTILQLARLVARLSAHPGLQVRLPPEHAERQAEFRSSGHFDLARMARLGWRPTTEPEQGLQRTLRYFSPS
ncbi:Nucleoside-diphosphate-sugar epimerase [Pseudomonas flavescens]|uniref:Nucleoside-diphosphate-sugar epimerase n=1 Tax=Phytopseudomonas flavescens TaxID=29435 RepID=A0A1G8J8U3_9GAMM|nr:NAD-dependent epimerase/dehydratase family protein [Pseudomonas flavescens]SDI27688.1 Nucleoside-diphosphate-sugar epimerase [Pseudomonas flavescens]